MENQKAYVWAQNDKFYVGNAHIVSKDPTSKEFLHSEHNIIKQCAFVHVGCGPQGRFTLQWRSAPVGQEV